jgi:hypothetical protein
MAPLRVSGRGHQSVFDLGETRPLLFDRATSALGFQPTLFGSQGRPSLAARWPGRQRLTQQGYKSLHGEAFIRQLTPCGLDNHPQDAILADAPGKGRVNTRLLDIAQTRGAIQIEQQRDSGADLVDMLSPWPACRGGCKSQLIRRENCVRRQTKYWFIHIKIHFDPPAVQLPITLKEDRREGVFSGNAVSRGKQGRKHDFRRIGLARSSGWRHVLPGDLRKIAASRSMPNRAKIRPVDSRVFKTHLRP